jgi:signal transduction histidine kinase
MSTISKIKLLLAVVIISFVTAAGYISALVVQRQSALEQVSRYNVAWLLSQGVTEYARLEQRLSAFGGGDGDVTDEEVQLRFDIVANRVKLFEHGNVVEYLDSDPEQHATVRELSQVIDAVRPLIDGIAKPGNAVKVLRLLSPLDGKMVRLAAAGNRWGGDRVTEDQRQLMSLHWRFSTLAGGLIVCGILLITLLFWHNRMLTGAHHDLRALAEELRGQEQTAIAASQAKSEFLAMMSHEIRTPMNAVIGLSAVLINSNLDREAHHLANSIHDSSNSLLRLLNDILDISKLDAGKVELEMQSFSLTALVDGAISIFEGQALKKGLLVRTFVDDELPARSSVTSRGCGRSFSIS